jgi:histidinol-phosphate aminotransferase
MDEGIFCATILALRGLTDGEGIVVEPAFEVYEACIRALAGRVRHARFGTGFVLQPGDVLSQVTGNTRVVFLNDPHNPSGARIPAETVSAIASAAPHALVFVDEAYAEFASGSFIGHAVSRFGNVLVGRTFAKAFGLAGLRIGALIGPRPLIARMRDIVPPYSLNAFAAEALAAALDDVAFVEHYISEAAASRALIREFCERHALGAYPSEANFVLVRVGPRAAEVVATLASRGVLLRDRSDQPGCEGCIRITAGHVEDTRRALAALEEVLCGAP